MIREALAILAILDYDHPDAQWRAGRDFHDDERRLRIDVDGNSLLAVDVLGAYFNFHEAR